MREDNKTSPVGGVDREKHIDKISLKNAIETPFWMAVWAAEPERKISVEMSYSDLKIITDLIDDARLKRSRWIPVEERLPKEYGSYLVAWIPVGLEIEYDHYYEILEFDPDDESGWLDRIEQSPGDYEILAWMPLPERYKATN